MLEKISETNNVISLQAHKASGWNPGCCADLIAVLSGVDRLTEKVFLDFGHRVQTFHGSAQDISQCVGEVILLLQNEDGENALAQLQLLVERCDLWLDAADTKSLEICTLLQDVSRLMLNLEIPMAGLHKVVKTLHALRVSTRVEAARGNATGAEVLAESLNKLSLMIQEKSDAICSRIDSLDPLIRKSLDSEKDVQSGLVKQAQKEVADARQILSSFADTRVEAGQWTDTLKARAEEITRNFGEMIAALQFQDITRQRLEHMCKALGSLEGHIEEYHRRSGAEEDTATLQLFGCICSLQKEQLDLSVREFMGATDNLSENLQGMADSIVTMARDTSTLSQITSAGCDDRFAALNNVLQSIVERLEVTRRTHQDAGLILSDVCSGVRDVAGLVKDIEDIGEEIQLLAMNAAISAAHARKRGAGLDVVAQNIHSVADEASALALTLAEECLAISDKAFMLRDAERESQEKSDSLGALLKDADTRLSGLDDNSYRLVDFANSVEAKAVALAEEVASVVKTIDIQEVFASRLAPVSERLEYLGDWANEEFISDGDDSLEKLFSELELCYTMDSQRLVHERFVNKEHEAGVGPESSWQIGQDHGLGDNVDLF